MYTMNILFTTNKIYSMWLCTMYTTNTTYISNTIFISYKIYIMYNIYISYTIILFAWYVLCILYYVRNPQKLKIQYPMLEITISTWIWNTNLKGFGNAHVICHVNSLMQRCMFVLFIQSQLLQNAPLKKAIFATHRSMLNWVHYVRALI